MFINLENVVMQLTKGYNKENNRLPFEIKKLFLFLVEQEALLILILRTKTSSAYGAK